jgi:hypothetical protein
MKTVKENTKNVLKQQWREERAREIEMENRKILRKEEIRKYYSRGFIRGILWVVQHMIDRGREDIARALIKAAYIDRDICKEAGISRYDIKRYERFFTGENRATGGCDEYQ